MRTRLLLRKASLFLSSMTVLGTASTVEAQSELEATVSADVVSSYVWRGFKQAGASVQPALGIGYKGFSLSAWGSTDITGENAKEADFSASYITNRLKLVVTDYWWDGEKVYQYFSGPGNSGHMVEGTIGYTFSKSFPLSISWNTFFFGKGNKKVDGKNSYSTYVELGYPFPFVVKDIDFSISTGFTPWDNAIFGTEGFKFTSISLKASKNIKFSKSFSLPVYGNIIFNPVKNKEDINFVFGFTIN